MPKLELNQDQYTDVEKLGIGAYAPVTGFMGEADFHSVVDNLRLTSGDFFSLPIILDVDEEQRKVVEQSMARKEHIELYFCDERVGTLNASELYTVDKLAAAEKIFGYSTEEHAGVKRFLGLEDTFVAGDVELEKRHEFDFSKNELTPAESRALFAEKGWKTVVCFATRNVPHRGHEFIHREALKIADGLFIHITTPPPKAGNYTPLAINTAYTALIETQYGTNRAVVSHVSTTFRGAGPREALFQGLMKRNYGCTHYIIGRDHSGVGTFYDTYAAHALSEKHEHEMGINIIRQRGPFYCKVCEAVATDETCTGTGCQDPANVLALKSTFIRPDHSADVEIDERIVRPEIVKSLEGIQIIYE